MIKQIKDLPEHIVGFRATGNVTKEDYDTILVPKVDNLADKKDELKYLFVLETDAGNVSMGAWYDDFVKVGLKHITQWKKIAIVSNQSGLNKFTEMGGHLMPGEIRAFTIDELETAKKWLAE